MKLRKVYRNRRRASIEFKDQAEKDLIGASLDKLIEIQENAIKNTAALEGTAGEGGGSEDSLLEDVADQAELKILENYKKTRDMVINPPSTFTGVVGDEDPIGAEANKDDIVDETKIGNNNIELNNELESGGGEGQIITQKNIFDVVNGLNEAIAAMEQDGTSLLPGANNIEKYNKLIKLLEVAQIQKSKFERYTPKPRGFGNLFK